jgi:FMN phosphatase YigB (HAD superfamily)
VVFLVDVDNTLLNNDRIVSDMMAYLVDTIGRERGARYWRIFEQLRSELGYADYLGALQRYRIAEPRDVHLLELSSYLVDYPFADRLYADALAAIEHLGKWGPVVVLTDGDVVFQPRKVGRSGITAAVDGRVLIYIHKEVMLDDIEARYPADHYVMFDDKVRILAAMQARWGLRLTTVFVRQGHYAEDAKLLAQYPEADISLASIGDILTQDLPEFLGAGGGAVQPRDL